MNEENITNNDTNSSEKQFSQDEKFTKINALSPLASICVITLIGLVCVVIDFYLESE